MLLIPALCFSCRFGSKEGVYIKNTMFECVEVLQISILHYFRDAQARRATSLEGRVISYKLADRNGSAKISLRTRFEPIERFPFKEQKTGFGSETDSLLLSFGRDSDWVNHLLASRTRAPLTPDQNDVMEHFTNDLPVNLELD